jgi:hypothetical protein
VKNEGTSKKKYIGTTNGLKSKKLKEKQNENERSRTKVRQVTEEYKEEKLLLNILQ